MALYNSLNRVYNALSQVQTHPCYGEARPDKLEAPSLYVMQRWP